MCSCDLKGCTRSTGERRDLSRRGTFRASAPVDLVHPFLLLLRRPLRRFVCLGDAPAARGGAARRGGGAAWLLRALRCPPGVSGAPPRPPPPEPVGGLAHAPQRHSPGPGPAPPVPLGGVRA